MWTSRTSSLITWGAERSPVWDQARISLYITSLVQVLPTQAHGQRLLVADYDTATYKTMLCLRFFYPISARACNSFTVRCLIIDSAFQVSDGFDWYEVVPDGIDGEQR